MRKGFAREERRQGREVDEDAGGEKKDEAGAGETTLGRDEFAGMSWLGRRGLLKERELTEEVVVAGGLGVRKGRWGMV